MQFERYGVPKPEIKEYAILITQAEAGMVIKLNMIQAWCKKGGRIIPFADTLVINGVEIEPAVQVAELQEFFLDVRVIQLTRVSGELAGVPNLVRVVHCDDLAEEHTIYLMPEETVTVIDRFNPNSMRSQKRKKYRNPAAGARRQ